jgi:hypothetical protein
MLNWLRRKLRTRRALPAWREAAHEDVLGFD